MEVDTCNDIVPEAASTQPIITTGSNDVPSSHGSAVTTVNQMNTPTPSSSDVVVPGSSGKENVQNEVAGVKIPALGKYNLRTKSIQVRIETEKKRKNPRKEPKPKQRPPPLSKYRRKNANARERTRMQEINDAFEELKKRVPSIPGEAEESDHDSTSKLTKITTLRLAVNYIRALQKVLNEPIPRPASPPPASLDIPQRPLANVVILPTISEALDTEVIPVTINQFEQQQQQLQLQQLQRLQQQEQLNAHSISIMNPSYTINKATAQSINQSMPINSLPPPQLPPVGNIPIQAMSYNNNLNNNISNNPISTISTNVLDTLNFGDKLADFDLDPMDELNSFDPISVDIDSLFMYQQHRSSSLCSDGLSCSSPSTSTETESLGSLKSGCSGGWDEGLGELPDTFDIILESDE
ncbi:uncharacterized protein LOC141850450 [Brevipalpus obovatus]|uniref:uncharacterized protein LOC141850450 n=1 Tax=Brevipalpus obovatus TaxID=246614 RepID=UPI003D9EC029